MNQRRYCHCGRNAAFLMFRDNVLPPEILLHLFCPECRHQAVWDDQTMLEDCGWILEYDVERVQTYFARKGIKGPGTPAFMFDEGYLTWQGFAPGDQEVNTRLHRRLAPLIEQDLALYLQTLRQEWLAHVARLKAAGWRKAQAA